MKHHTHIPKYCRGAGLVLMLVALAATGFCQTNPDCCLGRVGDADGLGGDEPTIADVATIINAMFIAGTDCTESLLCLTEADVNFSGGLQPSCADITLSDIAILIDYLFITGPSLGLNDCPEPGTVPFGYVVDRTGCNFDEATEGAALSSSTTCLQYQYDGAGTLDLTHLDAVLNCCPLPSLSVEIEDNLITITEADDGLCDCYCLYDIDYRIENLPPGEYRIVVNEAYPADGDPIDFTVDLYESASGLQCVSRVGYPWGGSGATEGYVVDYSECKSFGGTPRSGPLPPNMDCIDYSYDGASTLTLLHANTGFNCCPTSLFAEFSLEGSTLTITEGEDLTGGGCHCLCLYDMYYAVVNLPPGEYRIIVNGMYTEDNSDPLDFTVDLTEATSGSFCVERTEYPWSLPPPELEFIGDSGCLGSGEARSAESTGQTCVVYEYDETGTLSIHHEMTAFNCCPESIGAEMSVEGNSITITEYEVAGEYLCRCECLFDLEYRIANLPPGIYEISIVEANLPEGDQPIVLTLDLTAPLNDTYCVARNGYPW